MLRNYLLVAWRNLRSRIGPTVINVVGLAVGLAACLLIGLWIEHELSYDTFHPEADRVHRVLLDTKAGGNQIYTPQVPAPLKQVLRREVPEVETVTQFMPQREGVLRRVNDSFTENTVVYADSTFLDVFEGFLLRRGDRGTALDAPNALVITATTAQRIFGRTNVVGETLQIQSAGGRAQSMLEGTLTRQVTGVLADVPETSHLQFDAIVPYVSAPPVFRDNWTGFAFYTYAKLNEGASVAAFNEKLSTIATEYGAADVQERFNFPPEEISYEFLAESLPSIHLYSDFNSLDAGGSITTVYVFGAIGLFILLIACINFMNLATARAGERATEVGMRKALGARRQQLAGQFLGEAVLTTAAATGLALAGAALILPAFNDLAGTSMGVSALLQPPILIAGLLLIVIVGLVSGSYPAFVLSRFSPAATLRAGAAHTSSGQDRRIRQGLVVFQFAISIMLLVGTLVAHEQFDYIQNKRLGFDKERVVEIEGASDLGNRQTTFVDRVRRLPGVTAASAGDGLFGGSSGTAFWPADSAATASRPLRFFMVDPQFAETMDIKIIEGRSFDPARPSDSMAVVINQATADAYGWEAPTQRRLASGDTSAAVYDVIGVTDNFHYQSMRQKVEPAALFIKHPFGGGEPRPPSSVYARLAPDTPSGTLNEIRSTWAEVAGTAPFQYSFVDQTYDQLHRDVQRAGTLFSLFAGLAVVIACLGLFGLATYTVQRRRKEIGIRKALGATVPQVVGLVSKEFVQLVAIAAVIGLPVAYFAMQRWLQDFAYQTTIGVDVMAGAVGLAGSVALIAIGYHAVIAARLSPSLTLRDE